MFKARGLISSSSKDDLAISPYKHISSKVCALNDKLPSEQKIYDKMANSGSTAQACRKNSDGNALLE